jgi:two-component system response regulator YesN
VIQNSKTLWSEKAADVGWEVFSDEENRLVLLSWSTEKQILFQENLKIAEQIQRQLGGLDLPPLGIGIGEPVADRHLLPKVYRDTLEALQIGRLQGKQGIITYRELGRRIDDNGATLRDWPKALGNAIKTVQMAKVYETIDCMIADIKKKRISLEQYEALIERIAAIIVITLDELEINEKELFDRVSNPFVELSQLKTLDELRSWCSAVAESCIAIVRARQINFAEQKVREALTYLQQHYGNSALSIQTLCKDLFISTSYFSAIIKTYTGKTFIELLTEIRINKAKELLRTTTLKTYEIAEQVGYQDSHYFSITFKKVTGKSPSEYRSEYD